MNITALCTKIHRQLPGVLLVTVTLLLPLPGSATTLVGLDIDEVAAQAELIFEGEVVAHDIQREIRSGLIYTYVTFVVTDIIKGDFPGQTLELRFTGGEYGGEAVQVSGLTIPPVGEQGIYFVESTSRALLNPLLGWSQGHFVIVEEEGERRVRTTDAAPVVDIQPMANIPATIRRPQPLIEGKSDAAAGVVTDSRALTAERALTVDQFKTRIRSLLE